MFILMDLVFIERPAHDMVTHNPDSHSSLTLYDPQ